MDCYKQIIDDSLLSKQNNVDLSYFIKEISIKQFFIKKVYERNTAFKERVLVSHVMGTAFNSAG